ncbi:MAG TPA: DMT family transporter, partial [Gammaproteobacteria bacterium]|nr:DMT family transporter [Gammaproteobacteria bacterium]
VMVLFYLLPVWGVLGGYIFLKEKIDLARGLAVAIALIGAVLVLGGFNAFNGNLSWSDGLAITASLTFAANNLVFRARQNAPVQSKVAAMLIGCSVIAAILVGIQIQPWPTVSSGSLAYVALFGVFVLVATTGTQYGVTHMEAGRASIIIILELITAVISAMLLAGETMTTMEWTGGLLILSAAVIEARRSEPATNIAPVSAA